MFRKFRKNRKNNSNDCNIYFTIFHQNIQHLASRIDQLLIILQEINPEIITEHKLNENEMEKLKIPGYTSAHWYVRINYEGGGVLILILKNVTNV